MIQHQVFLDGSQEPASGGDRLFHRTDAVVPGFFSTVGIDLLQGRDFDASDLPDGPRVAVINRTMAEQAWPGEEAVGKRFHFDYPDEPPVTVIGVVEDAKYRYVQEDPQFFIYVPFSQALPSAATLHVRTAGDPEAILPALRTTIHELAPALPLADVATMDHFVAEALWLERASTGFLGVLGLLALTLVVIGIHGVMSYSVRRRMRELGVRISLGAERGRIVRLILSETGWWVVAGALVGVVGIVLVFRPAVSAFLRGVDPLTTTAFVVLSVALIAAAALLGALRPALAASRARPAELLRNRE